MPLLLSNTHFPRDCPLGPACLRLQVSMAMYFKVTLW